MRVVSSFIQAPTSLVTSILERYPGQHESYIVERSYSVKFILNARDSTNDTDWLAKELQPLLSEQDILAVRAYQEDNTIEYIIRHRRIDKLDFNELVEQALLRAID